MLLFVTVYAVCVCVRACLCVCLSARVCVCVCVEQKDRTPFGICCVNFQQNSCEDD